MSFREQAIKYCDAVLEHARDHYGPVHTPMFCQMIDLETLEVPEQRSAAEWRAIMESWEEDRGYLMWGKDRSNLGWAHDSNLLWDVATIRLMRRLDHVTGKDGYREATEQYISFFLSHCASPTTGLFAWGEHIAWDVETDTIHGERHELQNPDPLWEELWDTDSDAVTREIEAIYEYHVVDKTTFCYDRHARYHDGLPERDRATILGYLGVFASSWAFLWTKTGDERYLCWARCLARAFQSRGNADGLYPDNWSDSEARELPYRWEPQFQITPALFRVYELSGDPWWRDEATRYANAAWRAVQQGREDTAFATDNSRALRATLACAEHTRHGLWLDRAKQVAGNMVTAGVPVTQMASHMAERITSLIELARLSGEPRWLETAEEYGERAVSDFTHESGLIKGTAVVKRRDYYDAIQGPGALATAFLDLEEALHPESPPALSRPWFAERRPAPPAVEICEAPTECPNDTPALFVVRIDEPGRVRDVCLPVTVLGKVGARARCLSQSGDRWEFALDPPDEDVEGIVKWCVEYTVDDSPARVERTPWRAFEYVTVDRGVADADGCISAGRTGVGLSGLVPGSRATVLAAKDMELTSPTGWRPIPRLFRVSADRTEAARISLPVRPEDVDRMIIETAAPARRDGGKWEKSSDVRIEGSERVVSGMLNGPGDWTIHGRDRVLWRGHGRESNPTAADIDGDGAMELVLCRNAEGELLSSDGTSRFVLPFQRSNRPVQNTSSPVFADVNGDGEGELVYGATSGHLHCATPRGELLWSTAVGGEVRGGIALSRLQNSPTIALLTTWHDAGLCAVDGAGRLLWQRNLTPEADVTPVVVSDGFHEPLVLTASADGISAFRVADGELIWRTPTPGSRPVAPAVGMIKDRGALVIATGDETGHITGLDAGGCRLSQWQVPFEHEAYRPIIEVALVDLAGEGQRSLVVSTSGGEVRTYDEHGGHGWTYTTHEKDKGIALALGAKLGFADLRGDATACVVAAGQDQHVHAIGPDGVKLWEFRADFFYHYAPVIADLAGDGELIVVTTSPCEGGTYALRTGAACSPGSAPWPTFRGGFDRRHCYPAGVR